jgi:hypothetical protein
MKLLYFSLGAILFFLLARFILEPDYIPGFAKRNNAVRCNAGEYWIDELERKLHS